MAVCAVHVKDSIMRMLEKAVLQSVDQSTFNRQSGQCEHTWTDPLEPGNFWFGEDALRTIPFI